MKTTIELDGDFVRQAVAEKINNARYVLTVDPASVAIQNGGCIINADILPEPPEPRRRVK